VRQVIWLKTASACVSLVQSSPCIEPVLRTARPVQRQLGSQTAGLEVFWGPMAYAVIGGLSVATALTLVFLPALYVAWFRVKEPEVMLVRRADLTRRQRLPRPHIGLRDTRSSVWTEPAIGVSAYPHRLYGPAAARARAGVGRDAFQCTTEGFVLTDEGSAALGHAERIREEVPAFERQLAGRDSGPVRSLSLPRTSSGVA
jgi:hypothetical protein